MVMHARKLPRISDGFSEKHQPHSHTYETKYTTKYRFGNHDKSRDSPSANSLRSSSPDSQSPRYHKTNYYKVREKERERENREREREREYKDYRDRENSRSPKERRRDREREKDRESRSERINVHKKDEKERLMRVGEWSEHVSSSGKKYYYNCRSEVSQWEKPPEWIEWERNHRSAALKDSNIHRSHDKINRPDKHSTLADNYRDHRESNDHVRERRDYRNDDHFDRRDVRKYPQDVGTTDMEISSGDSTPTSEGMHHSRNESVQETQVTSHPHYGVPTRNLKPNVTPVISTSTSDYPPVSINSSALPTAVPQLLNSHPRLTALSNLPESKLEDGVKLSKVPLEPLNITSNTNNCSGGPPTPTHSENHDSVDLRKAVSSPNTGLNSLHSLAQGTSSIPTLTPSLANYYKESLIGHVQGWPADAIEKQCQRSFEEAHTMSSVIMTKVSAELKMARSLVRLAEIQATLHEQRILFLRAQKRTLEEVKAQNCFMNDP